MKNFYTSILLLGLFIGGTITSKAADDPFISDGSGKVYTFESLSKLVPEITVANGNEYTVPISFTISAKDTLKLDNKAIIKMASSSVITIKGYADFTPADTASIIPANDGDTPKGIYVYDDGSKGKFRHIYFEGAGIKSYNGVLDAENCTFNKTNTKLSNGAVYFAGSVDGNIVNKCTFTECTCCAVGSGANCANGIKITNCYFYNNDVSLRNYPHINYNTAGDYIVEVSGNTIIGVKDQNTMSGGIGVTNMLSLGGTNKVIIKDNVVKDCRYGITTLGKMDVQIVNNQLIDNKYETNAMNGGSAISIYDSSYLQDAYIEGNLLQGSLWGLTIIGGKNVNVGKTNDIAAADYNPGKNVFKDNGNGGVLYDLYNNGTNTVFAQGNTWNVAVQDKASIAQVIFDKSDDSSLGEVIYMPGEGSVEGTLGNAKVEYDAASKSIKSVGEMNVAVYAVNGECVAEVKGSDEVSLPQLASGIYIAKVVANNGISILKFRF